jgi:2',3'-cyclic-nucleotide 2'-phosphodiesterase/3'-nucleotidase
MGGCWGAHIGVIDLLLTHDGGSWQVLGTRSCVRAATERRSPAPSQAVVEAVAQAHDETLTAVRRPVGSVAAPLHSYFTHLGRTDALRIVAEAQTAHIRKNLKDPTLAELPILAAIAPFKAGGRGGPGGYTDVPEGPVALRHIADLYAFPNAIAALKLTGEQIIEWLERSAAAYNQVKPGSMGTMLRNADVPGYNFEVIYPLDVTYDISQPARYDYTGKLIDPQAHRVANVLLNGEPLDLQGHYIVSTNSYRAGGAGAFAGARAENIVYQSPQVVRDMVRDYVQGSQIVTPKMLGAVRIKPLQNTQVIYETGPDAMQHLTQIAGYRPEPRGITRSGFLRLKLDLSQSA